MYDDIDVLLDLLCKCDDPIQLTYYWVRDGRITLSMFRELVKVEGVFDCP